MNPIILVHPFNPEDLIILLTCLYVCVGYMKAELGCKQGKHCALKDMCHSCCSYKGIDYGSMRIAITSTAVMFFFLYI